MSTLAVLGHSLGGGTAVSVAAKDKRIKAALATDAWFLPYKDDLEAMVCKDTPFFHQTSENYYYS